MAGAAPRKLLFYTHALEAGGAERVVGLLASGFAERGDDVTIAVDRHVETNVPLTDKVRVITLGSGHARNLAALADLLRTEKPDVSFSALAASNFKHAIAAARAGRGSRAVISYHGYFSAEPQLLSRAGFLSLPITSRIVRRTVCVSDGLLAHIRRFGVSANRSVRIFNPVTLAGPAEAANAQPLTNRAPLVLAVGRLAEVKDFTTLIRAFARVQTPGAQLRIVGEGGERRRLETEIAALGLQDRIALPGHSRDVGVHYRAARCFALTSLTESFGNVVVEALSHGLPVVATDCGGPSEILNAANCGTIAPIGDVDAIARAIDATLASPGDSAPRRARAADFSIERSLDSYDALFRDVTRGGVD